MGAFTKCSQNTYLDCLCTYLIVAYVKNSVKSELSIYQIMQILSISAFDKTPISQLLNDFQNNQNVNEQQYNIFDNLK